MRYVVSTLPPPDIDQSLRQQYQDLTGQSLAIEHLHVTLIPTFFLKPGKSIEDVLTAVRANRYSPLQNCHFGTSNFFETNGKHILYLPLLPPESLTRINQDLKSKIHNLISFDLSPYSNHTLPPYLPHLTLDYDFKGKPDNLKSWTFMPGTTFSLQGPVIFTESEDGTWKIISSRIANHIF